MFTTMLALCLLAPNSPAKKPAPAQGHPSKAEVKQTILNSVGFLTREGNAWITERQCVSCHQVPSMLWSLREANRLGLKVDVRQLEQRTKWSLDWEHWKQPGAKDTEKQTQAKNVDTMVHLLLGRGSVRKASWVGQFARVLLREQKEDGSWAFGGQLGLQKRLPLESRQVTTMWTLLALASIKTPERSEHIRSAQSWLKTAKPGVSTEWLVTRTLVEHHLGDSDKAKKHLQALLNEQNANGGWGWLRGKSSDAFGTGLALYALAQVGRSPDEQTYRAWRFLQRTQRKDGSWAVPSTLKRRKNRLEPTAVYWGTAWAIIGLAHSLEPAPRWQSP